MTPDPSETLIVAVVAGRHRLNMVCAETGTYIGTMNIRPREAAKLQPSDLSQREALFCTMLTAMNTKSGRSFVPAPETHFSRFSDETLRDRS